MVLKDKCCPKVTPQSAAKTTRKNLDRYMYGTESQFLLRVQYRAAIKNNLTWNFSF